MTLKHKTKERIPAATYMIMGTMTEALARRESLMNKRPQPQIKFLRTVKTHTKMT
jgi:hypothetical protein